MSKKTWFFIILGILATATIIRVIVWLNLNKQYQSARILDHIPAQAFCLLKLQGLSTYNAVIDSLPYAQDLNNLLFSPASDEEMRNMVKTLSSNAHTNALLDRPIHISFHAMPDSSIKRLVIIKLDRPSEKQGIESILKPKHFSKSKNTIHSLLMGNDYKLSYASTEGILYLSDSEDLIMRAIELPVQESLGASPRFMEIYRTMSSSLPACLVFAPTLMPTGLFTSYNNKLLTNEVEWIQLDLDFKDKSILANGFLVPSKNSFTAMVIKESKTKSTAFDSLMPFNITGSLEYGEGSRGLDNPHYIAYLKAKGRFNQYLEAKNQTKISLGRDQEALLAKLFDTDMALYYINLNGTIENCLIVRANDSIETLNQFKTLFSQAEQPKKTFLNIREEIQITCYQSDLLNGQLFFLDDYFHNIPTTYYCQYNNTILMASNPAILEQNIISRIQNNTMAVREGFQGIRKLLSNQQQLFIFRNGVDFLQQEGLKVGIPWHHLGETALQVSSIQDLMYITMAIHHSPNREQQKTCLWQIKPDTLLHLKPSIVVNHNTLDEEIIFSDLNYNLYLCNSKGVVIWKKKLPNAIMGEITQIDFFKNKKLQYLFNSENKIFLIDRNGNHVPPFPLELPMKATNPVACFDYEGKGNYRFIIAGEDLKLHAFDIKGKQVEGFDAPLTRQVVKNKIQHFSSSGKDYLVYHDGEKIMVTDRRGGERITINSSIQPYARSSFHLIDKDQPNASLVSTTNKNEWLKIHLTTGKTEVKSTVFAKGHDHHFLKIPNQNRFMMLLEDKVLVLDDNGNVLFTSDAGTPHVSNASVAYASSNLQMITYYDSQKHNIHMIDHNGNQIKGFPYQGNSLVSIIVNKKDRVPQMYIFYTSDNTLCAVDATNK